MSSDKLTRIDGYILWLILIWLVLYGLWRVCGKPALSDLGALL